MDKRFLLLMMDGPSRGDLARERLDIALMGLALDARVSLAFVGDGVWQLLPQTEDGSGHSLLKVIRSLALYDVEAVYVEQESMLSRRIAAVDPLATVLPRAELAALLREQDHWL